MKIEKEIRTEDTEFQFHPDVVVSKEKEIKFPPITCACLLCVSILGRKSTMPNLYTYLFPSETFNIICAILDGRIQRIYNSCLPQLLPNSKSNKFNSMEPNISYGFLTTFICIYNADGSTT